GRTPPDTFLVWSYGGLPEGFGRRLRSEPWVRRSVVVESDNTWLTGSLAADGRIVDDPPGRYAIPLEVAAVDPDDYAWFLPPVDRGVTRALAAGQGVLGTSSAALRGLGPGAVLEFGDVRVEVAGVLPDELVGANELLVSREVGRAIGVRRARYALLEPRRRMGTGEIARRVRPLFPPGTPFQVRAPGDTPYFRHGDAVLPPVRIKMLFGEFAARPDPDRPGYLLIDPAWVKEHIATVRVPLLGEITCNVAIIPQIEGAMRELIRLGYADLVRSYHGCYSPRHILRDPTANLSHHAWGIAFDINLAGNAFGEPPHQDPHLVRVLERWGFIWGGRFIVPDGNHFE
ncbi:MAG TPA: M15 family metallopeptidase, partial [Actinomycetota bacterium]|nr:M15 family metallopeptidase [Actinomycetota bacterium]